MHKTLTKIFLILSIFILILTPIRILFAAENPISPEVKLNTPIPGANSSTEVVQNLGDYLGKIYNFGIAIAGILAFVMITVGGIMYTSSTYTGNVMKGQSGKDYINSALLGLAVALLSYLFIYTIDPELTHPKYVFEAIPDAVCVGGYGNTENPEKCKGYCTAGTTELLATYNQATKCCTCGMEHIEENQDEANCTKLCKSSLKCKGGDESKCWGTFFNGQCVCQETKFENPTECKNGEAKVSRESCNAFCHLKDPAFVPVWDIGTKCCSCTAIGQ
jgi:hypothetical protein